MAGFVGYIVHENHIHWPWAPVGGMADYSAFEGLSAPAIWDKIGFEAQAQIILAIGFFEVWSETKDVLEEEGQKHYMMGGKPGYFPSFKKLFHPVPFNLYDPFKWNTEKSDEWKSKRLLTEINNGRLAMLGLMGFVSEAKVPGAVPALAGKIKPYAGEVMGPFSSGDINLPFVKDMLTFTL